VRRVRSGAEKTNGLLRRFSVSIDRRPIQRFFGNSCGASQRTCLPFFSFVRAIISASERNRVLLCSAALGIRVRNSVKLLRRQSQVFLKLFLRFSDANCYTLLFINVLYVNNKFTDLTFARFFAFVREIYLSRACTCVFVKD